MTYPGSQANQQAQLAAQVAQAAANRGAQQNAAYGAGLNNRHPRYPTRRVGVLGRLISIVVTVAVLLIMASVGLVVLSSVDPHLVEPVWHWLDTLN